MTRPPTRPYLMFSGTFPQSTERNNSRPLITGLSSLEYARRNTAKYRRNCSRRQRTAAPTVFYALILSIRGPGTLPRVIIESYQELVCDPERQARKTQSGLN